MFSYSEDKRLKKLQSTVKSLLVALKLLMHSIIFFVPGTFERYTQAVKLTNSMDSVIFEPQTV
jgi:hypothetical protein